MSGPAGERARYQRIAHWLVRLLAVVNLLHLGAMSFRSYFRVVAGGTIGSVAGTWMVASTVLLPVFAGFECWWMRNDAQARALVVDWVFVVAWIVVFWGSVIYALGHYAIP